MAVVGMLLFKRGFRNHADNSTAKSNYSRNFERLFGCRLPDLNTSNSLLKELDTEELEEIKRNMVQLLLRAKVLEKYKLFGAYLLIGIDATGVHSFNYKPYLEYPSIRHTKMVKGHGRHTCQQPKFCAGTDLARITHVVKMQRRKNYGYE